MKNLLRALVAISVAACPGFAYGEFGPPPLEGFVQVPLPEASSRLPDVIVRDVRADGESKAPVTSGRALTGKFSAFNPSDLPAEVTFEVGLIGLGADGQPRDVLALDVQNEIFSLGAGETREVAFSLLVPAGAAADAAKVKVQARLAGSVYRGWGYGEVLAVEGDGNFAVVEQAYFRLADGSTVSADSGPTVYPEAPISLVAKMRPIGSGVVVTPVLDAKNRGTGAPVLKKSEPFLADAGVVSEVAVPLSADADPGVYEGVIRFLDAAGRDRATPVNFRYIVAGQAATVHAAVSSAGSVEKGEKFSVAVMLSGTPVDVSRLPEAVAAPAATVSISVRDSSGREVASGQASAPLGESSEVAFKLEASRDADGLEATITVADESGKTLSSRTMPLLPSLGKATSAPEADSFASTAYLLVAASLLVAALPCWRTGRRKAAATLVTLSLAAATLAAFPSIVRAVTATAHVPAYNVTVTETWVDGHVPVCLSGIVNPPSLYVNSPNPDGASLACGANLDVDVSVSYVYCSNAASSGTTWIWLARQQPDGSFAQVGSTVTNQNFSFGGGGGHDHPFVWAGSSASFGALGEPGNYRVYVKALSSTACSTTATGYREFTVSSCDECPNISGSQDAVPAGLIKDAAGSCVPADTCPNLLGAQSSVPSGMVKNAGGDCVCVTGTSFDAATGRCVCADGSATCDGGGGGTGCPIGQKYCDGVCVADDVSCDTVIADMCVLEPEGDQYCVEIYGRDGSRTGQLADLSAIDLEQTFGAGLPLALDQQRQALAAGSPTYPIWGVVGRVVAGAHESSTGCAGALCLYGEEGCLTSVNPVDGGLVGNCCPLGGDKEPSAAIHVEPALIGRGGSCRVFWGSHEMSSCQVTGPGISVNALAGKATTPPIFETSVYTLSCVGLDGQARRDSGTCAVDPNVAEF